MKVLIDSNILLDVALHRDEFYANSQRAITIIMKSAITAYVSALSIANIDYILKRSKMPTLERRDFLLRVCSFAKIIGLNENNVIDALLDSHFTDFEDCLQAENAKNIDAEYIFTRNIKDFTGSPVPAISPEYFFDLIQNRGIFITSIK